MKLLSILAALAAAAPLNAAILQKVPGPPGMPMTQGSMIHANIVFTNSPTGTFDVTLDAGVPDMKPLTLWSPGDSFDPADPWFSALDPTGGAGLFSGRYGFMLDVGGSDPRPSAMGIRFVPSGTPGLQAFFTRWTAGSELFDQVFLAPPGRDYVLWSGAMWHPVFVMPAGTPFGTTVTANFEMFMAEQGFAADVDYTTNATVDTDYERRSFSLTFNVVPEPGAFGMVGMGLALLWWHRRRR